MDSLTSVGVSEQETQEIKDTSTPLFAEVGFTLQIWCSNVPSLEKSAPKTEGNEDCHLCKITVGKQMYQD